MGETPPNCHAIPYPPLEPTTVTTMADRNSLGKDKALVVKPSKINELPQPEKSVSRGWLQFRSEPGSTPPPSRINSCSASYGITRLRPIRTVRSLPFFAYLRNVLLETLVISAPSLKETASGNGGIKVHLHGDMGTAVTFTSSECAFSIRSGKSLRGEKIVHSRAVTRLIRN